MSSAVYMRMMSISDIYKWSVFGQRSCTFEAGPNKTEYETQDLFFFSLSLSFTMKWEICQY